MSLSKYVDPIRCFQLISGVAGIYISYLVTGIIHESMYPSAQQGSKKHIPMIKPAPRTSLAGPPDSLSSPAESPGSSEKQSTTGK